MDKEPKRAKLLNDEFYPSEAKLPFWMLPKAILAHETLSPGAKLLYCVIYSLCYKKGTAWPEHKTLRNYMGGVSEKTINRYQQELTRGGYIRPKQKGRGLPNNYYCLRSATLGNAEEYEFIEGPRYRYVNKQTGIEMILSEGEGQAFFEEDARLWYQSAIQGNIYNFPKPCWHYNRLWYKKVKQQFENQLAEYVDKS